MPKAKTPPVKTSPERRRLLAAIHAAKKAAGLDDDTYRAMLEAQVGLRSAADCTDAQLGRIVDHLNGGKGQAGRKSNAPNSAVVGKIRALWWSLGELGAVRNPSAQALAAFVKGRAGVDRLEWISGQDAFKVIEALKDMGTRAGVAWDKFPTPQGAIIAAQLAKLNRLAGSVSGFCPADNALVQQLGGIAYTSSKGREANDMVKRLGKLIVKYGGDDDRPA